MDIECVVIGAGVVGLGIAAELARTRSVIVLEQHDRPGQETSSHNSEVLHAGLYYPTGSLKATLCVEGNRILQELGQAGKLTVKLTGKLIVAQPGEEGALEDLLKQARDNGVEGLERLSRAQLQQLEPRVRAAEALLSRNTGILDSHGLMRHFQIGAESLGAVVVCRTKVVGLTPCSGGYRLETVGPDGTLTSLETLQVVNAAGLYADRVAERVGIPVDSLGYRQRFCRGDYFSLSARHTGTLSHLVYPVPGRHAAGLGIHVTLDLAGRVRLGPDTTWLAEGAAPDYRVDPGKLQAFAEAVRRYLPDVQDSDLSPELAGVRPKLQRPGTPARDFVIEDGGNHGFSGLINLIGIESPGLTASPAIARRVAEMLAPP